MVGGVQSHQPGKLVTRGFDSHFIRCYGWNLRNFRLHRRYGDCRSPIRAVLVDRIRANQLREYAQTKGLTYNSRGGPGIGRSFWASTIGPDLRTDRVREWTLLFRPQQLMRVEEINTVLSDS